MRLDITELGAFALSTLFASTFVVSVYIWKPFTKRPPELLKIWQKPKYQLTRLERDMIDAYENKMRIRSVGTLCILAAVLICVMADMGDRPQVGVLRWFGLSIDKDALKHTLMVLVLNSVFFSGELYQLFRGMTWFNH